MTPRKLLPFTVVGLDMQHDELIVEHVYAKDARGCTRVFLTGRADCRRFLCAFNGHLHAAK